MFASRFIDISECRSVCLALGPYRNLTTLTAAVLFLHPNCQVLNHGGPRIFGNRKVDFLSDYSPERFDRFVRYAVRISSRGERGPFGGSVLHSHAFDPGHEAQRLFRESGSNPVKQRIHCLFWKESLRTSNLIRRQNIDLGLLLDREPRLRFLMPIRNPMDCAVSNLKTGHFRLFTGLDETATVLDVLRAILEEIRVFAEYREAFPGRFFCFLEHEINRDMLINLSAFLQLDNNEKWLADACAAMVNRSGYRHDEGIPGYYRDSVNAMFSRFPALQSGLLAFLNGSGTASRAPG